MIPLKFKTGVVINGRHTDPDIIQMLYVTRITAPDLTDHCVWVTSANDSRHMSGSKHYSNEAFDIRIRNVKYKKDIAPWALRIKRGLGKDYDVILEEDHIHCERDVKNG